VALLLGAVSAPLVASVLRVDLVPSVMLLLEAMSVPSAMSMLMVVLLLEEVWALLVASTRGVVFASSTGAPAASPPHCLSSRP
jgi:hypothetical protein